MTSDQPNIDPQQLEKLFGHMMRWSTLDVTYRDLLKEAKRIVSDMRQYSLSTALPILAGLLTLPGYQANCLRIELLVGMACLSCRGRKKTNTGQAVRWFRQLGETQCVGGEDPAEDLFITNLCDQDGNYLLFEGLWENSGFYTQQILDVVNTLPGTPQYTQISRSFRAVLKLSDHIARRSRLDRYIVGDTEPKRLLDPLSLPKNDELTKRVTFSSTELAGLDITPADILPFWTVDLDSPLLLDDTPGNSSLELHPIVQIDSDTFVVAFPSAISIAARQMFIDFIITENLGDQFNKVFSDLYSDLIYKTPLLGGRGRAPVHWSKIAGTNFASFSIEVDRGYVFSYLLYLPDITGHNAGGFKTPVVDDGTLSATISTFIQGIVDESRKRTDFRQGTVLLVGCGWGKGYAIRDIEFDHDSWEFDHLPIADLIRVSWLPGISPIYFILLQEGLQAAVSAGLQIMNINGILNLMAWDRQNKGHIIPHRMFLDSDPSDGRANLLSIPQDGLRSIREETDQRRDLHSVRDHLGQFRVVQRANIEPFFLSDESDQIYVCIEDINSRNFLSVYEGQVVVWISIIAEKFEDRDTVYRLWEMAREWIPRIVKQLPSAVVVNVAASPLLIELIFEGDGRIDAISPLPNKQMLSESAVLSESDSADGIARILFSAAFLAGFRHPLNLAERCIVQRMLQAIARHSGILESIVDIDKAVDDIVRNDDARSFHAIHAHEFLQYVHDSLPDRLISLNETDDAIVKLGLARKAITKDTKGTISGVSECTQFLNKVVSALIDEIKEDLRPYNRLDTMLKIYNNVEKASSEEDHWRRTSAAVLGLHGSGPQTLDRYVEQSSLFSAAGVTGRILIEIGLCECHSDAASTLADLELSRMMAKASIVYRLGGLSDAIQYRALPAELHISPFGDILFKDEFGEFVVQPLLSKVIGQRFLTQTNKQRDNYSEPQIIKFVEDKFEPEFWQSWTDEFGFTIDEGRAILTLIENVGVDKGMAVFEMRKLEFLDVMTAGEVDARSAAAFLETFTLKARPKWDEVPSTFSMRDIFPWAFGRRLSVVSRPILQIDNADPNCSLIVAPNSLRISFRYLVSGAHDAALPQSFFRSHRMRDLWWGKAGSGYAHASDVSDRAREAGWNVSSEIEPSHILNLKVDPKYGDVDVLVWSKDGSDVWIVECKDLSMAGNYSEIAHMLAEYQGVEKKGKADKLLRHLNRVELLRAHQEKVAKFCDLDKVQIRSALVCSGPVPMQYASIEALDNTFVGSVEDFIKELNVKSSPGS